MLWVNPEVVDLYQRVIEYGSDARVHHIELSSLITLDLYITFPVSTQCSPNPSTYQGLDSTLYYW